MERAPSTSADFDRAYRLPFTLWGDPRIPDEIKDLVRQAHPGRALELGCGVGRFSRWVAQQGVRVTGVDFSPVAVEKARARAAGDSAPPEFVVGDVTRLDTLTGPYDVSFDVGCFHCLLPDQQRAYASEVRRLLRPGGTHLVWALDGSPAGMRLSPEVVAAAVAPSLTLVRSEASRRRIIASRWYWLSRPAE
jgi:SAM-dependent methyltransferase